MAKRKYKKHRAKKKTPQRKIARETQPEQEKGHSFNLRQSFRFILPALVLACVVFLPVIRHEFIFWDDPEYILHNPYIQQIDLPAIFGNFYFGNYHPLTLLSYALEYKLAGLNPTLYHLDNLLLHLLNTLLVFVFISRLSRRQSQLIPLVCTLLFALHPMHVESVAWVSERKDVLFSAFFLSALICYTKYLDDTGNKKALLWTFILYLLSLFSKAQAVPLVLLLPLLDWYKGRGINRKILMEKLPFIALAVLFAILAVKAQQTQAAINPGYFGKMKSVFWASYSLAIYLYKAVLPIHLSGVYPYPLTAGRELPGYIYFFPLAGILFLAVVWRCRKRAREVTFGLLFFLIVISVVLKFIPVGDAIIAERYTYMPYVGLFFIMAFGFQSIIENKRFAKAKKGLLTLGVAIILVLSYSSFRRTSVWHNTRSFWEDVIEKQTHYWQGYSNLAQSHYEAGDYAKAVELYTQATEMDPNCPPIPWLWRGMIYTDHMPDYDRAISDFQKVMSFPNKADQSYVDATINLGLAYYRKNDLHKALDAHNNAVVRYPDNPRAYFLRGLTLKALKRDGEAVADFTQAIQLKPDYYQAYLNRGVIYTDRLAQYDKALADFQQVLQLNPAMGNALLNVGLTYYKMGQYTKSLEIYNRYLSGDAGNGRACYLRALTFAALGRYQKALEDAAAAEQGGNRMDPALINQWRMKAGQR